MKKVFSLFVITMLLCTVISSTSYAKSGDIAGVYYGTDIRTFLNGVEISAINIGGETLISGEDMVYYGFNVVWSPGERALWIVESVFSANGAPPTVKQSQIPTGTVLGNYFETDIVTYLDNTPILAYNIGGRTYVHAEEMRKYGYDVLWNADERTLKITSPIRAGYVYKVPLSYGEDKGWGNGNPGIDGVGVCSVKYTPEGLWGTDDADYFDMTMHASARDYCFDMVFHQSKALFNSHALMNKIQPLCYDGYAVETPCDKSEKYDWVNQNISISINGHKAEKVSVLSGAGNGYRGFYFVVEDLPRFSREEIWEISFSVGESTGALYPISVPEYVTNGPDAIAETIKKSSNDYVVTVYQTEKHYVYYMKEFLSLGVVKDRLYIYDRVTHEASDDILEQVRRMPGFNYDVIRPFAFRIGDIESNFFFACDSPEKTMDFYVNLDTHMVYDLEGNAIVH